MNFDKNLLLLRTKKKLSQEELAYSIGVSRQTVNAWECGTSYPNIIMLKTLSDFFNVSADELLNGLSVKRLPTYLNAINLIPLGKYKGEVYYNELPNWFIQIAPDAEVSWAIYDSGIKDYSYHMGVTGKARVHGFDCWEIKVEEYNSNLDLEQTYFFFASRQKEGIYWVGKTSFINGVKVINTFKDQEFLNDWGVGGKFKPSPMKFKSADKYMLEYGDSKQEVIQITYFGSNAADVKEDYFEVYLNKDFESLLWKRYSKKIKNASDNKIINGIEYGLESTCITSRL